MLQVIPKRKAVAILSALVVVGMWSNAMAAVFCPHMSGSSDSCLTQNAKVLHSDRARDASSSMHPSQMNHTQMSEMDMQELNEPCSHCMMHSRSGASYPLKSAVQNSFSTQIVAVESIAGNKNSVLSCLTLVDLHDHSPPGSSAPLYVLVSAFRI